MSCGVPCKVFRDTAPFGYGTYSIQAGHVMGDREYPSVLTQSAVFFYDSSGQVQQADIRFHARLLAVDVYPLMVVEVCTDIFLTQIAHIGE